MRIREVIFFAVPHLGTETANIFGKLSFGHRQLNQLRIGADFIDLLTEDWVTYRCENRVGVTYVVAGQDGVVSRKSASSGQRANVEMIPHKNHRNVVEPEDKNDIAFLLVKREARQLLTDVVDDFAEVRRAIGENNAVLLTSLLINRGRSWIEGTEAGQAIALFSEIEAKFDPDSKQVIWSHYLSAIAQLFRERVPPAAAFDDRYLARAERYNLRLLVLAKRLEFARKRSDDATLEIAMQLTREVSANLSPSSPEESYAVGVAFYLIGNLQRFGGMYNNASDSIERSRTFFRPAILSHQVELAHCEYALTVCRTMLGHRVDVSPPVALGLEFRKFAYALSMLASSHSAWAKGQHGEAIEDAENASNVFQQLQFAEYARRADTLKSLLEAWRRLELGAPRDQVAQQVGNNELALATLLGDYSNVDRFGDWIARARPSRVLGMLQFASAYNPNWTQEIGPFSLPRLLETYDGEKLRWKQLICRSLAEADHALRTTMAIDHGGRIPLLAD